MAKKKEGPIQWDITSEEEWQELLKKDGLWLVDVYRDWSGPCICIQSMLKKIKTEIEDEILQFAMAPADKIEQLAPFRETCEPQWLFVAGGQFVAFIKGTNVVNLMDLIKAEVVQERAVMSGKATRRLVKNVKSLTKTVKSILDLEKEQVEMKKIFVNSIHKIRDIAKIKLTAKDLLGKSYTLSIIKPDAVQAGKTHAILHELKENGFRLLHQQERVLTDDDVGEIYRLEKNYNYALFGLARLMTHGPSIILILTSIQPNEDTVEKLRLILGPPNSTIAKKDYPASLRAKFGTEGFNNGIHASQSKAAAERELNLFFPGVTEELGDGVSLSLKPLSNIVEYALIMVRPHTMANFHLETILGSFERANLNILAESSIKFTPDNIKEFYKYTPAPRLKECLLSGLTHLVVIEGSNLYSGRLFQIFGPDLASEARKKHENCLRAIYSKDDKSPSAFHVSESQDVADHEVPIFFPQLSLELQQIRNIQFKTSKVDIKRTYSKLKKMQQIVVIVSPKAIQIHNVEEIVNCFKNARFTIYAQKHAVLSHDQAAQFLKPFNDLYVYPRMVKDLLNEPSVILCILCEEAISRLKEFLGPWDPLKAKRYAPKSLRAIYATQEISPFYMTEKPESLTTDVKMFFPELLLQTSRLAVTTFPQHCVVFISPYMVQKYKTNYILQLFDEDEIPIVLDRFVQFTPNMIHDMYFIHRTAIIWNRTVKVLTNGEMLVLAIYMTDAVRQVNDSLEHGRLATLSINCKDAIHMRASLDVVEARKEMEMFFPRETVIAMIKPDAYLNHKEKILQMIANVGLLIVGQSVEKLTEEQAMTFHAHHSKESYFLPLVQNSAKGKVLLLALSGFSAGIAFEMLMGPKDPAEAALSAPKTIRALFGRNIIENAVDLCTDPSVLDKLYSTPAGRPVSLSTAAIGHAISIAA